MAGNAGRFVGFVCVFFFTLCFVCLFGCFICDCLKMFISTRLPELTGVEAYCSGVVPKVPSRRAHEQRYLASGCRCVNMVWWLRLSALQCTISADVVKVCPQHSPTPSVLIFAAEGEVLMMPDIKNHPEIKEL